MSSTCRMAPLMAGAELFERSRSRGGRPWFPPPTRRWTPSKPACDILLQIASIPAQYHNPRHLCHQPFQIHGGSANDIVPQA